jgi:plasmid stabilization system protein ParE
VQLIYLKSAEEDFRWMYYYYTHHFPEGGKKAWNRYLKNLQLLMHNPALGRPFGKLPRRRHTIPNTPFVIYYQVMADRFEIVRIWDTRRNIEHLYI